MSDTEVKPVFPAPPVITRNGIDKVLTKTAFGKKSKNFAGVPFFAPEVAQATWGNDSSWIGMDWVVAVVNKRLRLDFAEIFVDHYTDENGNINPVFPKDAYLADLQDFTAGVAKLADLQDDLDDLVGKAQEIVTAEDSVIDQTDNDGVPTAAAKAAMDMVKELNMQIKPIRAQIAAIKAKYEQRAKLREAKKAQKVANSPTAQAA